MAKLLLRVLSDEFNKRRRVEETPSCDYCKGTGIFGDNYGEPGKGAPNFYHKKTGLKIWWYKWIGCDMEFTNIQHAIKETFGECITSIQKLRNL